MELIEKLAALVPPPRKNLVRYHGILAPHAKNRDKVVPKRPNDEALQKTRDLGITDGASIKRHLSAARQFTK